MIESGTRGKARIKTWGSEETKNNNLSLVFGVEVYAVAPPNTYGDSDFDALERPKGAQVRVTLSQTANNDWIFDILKKITGDEDFDLERLDPDHAEPYDLEGTEVPILYKAKEWNGRTSLETSFLFPKPKGKLTTWGQKLMEYKVRQEMEKSADAPPPASVEDSPPKKGRKKQEA